MLNDCLGSEAAELPQNSEMTASRGKAAAQTKVFDFPELMSAYEGEADTWKLLFMRRLTSASGSLADIKKRKTWAKRARRSGPLISI